MRDESEGMKRVGDLGEMREELGEVKLGIEVCLYGDSFVV